MKRFFWFLLAVLLGITLAACGSLEDLSNADIKIEVVGVDVSELTTADFNKMSLVKREIALQKDDGRSETYTLTGVTFSELLNYLNVKKLTGCKLVAADGSTVEYPFPLMPISLFALYSSDKLLSDELGPVWFAAGNQTPEKTWLKSVVKVEILMNAESDVVYIPQGLNAIKYTAEAAGFDIAGLTKIPQEFTELPVIHLFKKTNSQVSMFWKKTEGDYIAFIQFEEEGEFSICESEPVEINGVIGEKVLEEAEGPMGPLPPYLVLSWRDGKKVYILSGNLSGGVTEKTMYQLAECVK